MQHFLIVIMTAKSHVRQNEMNITLHLLQYWLFHAGYCSDTSVSLLCVKEFLNSC